MEFSKNLLYILPIDVAEIIYQYIYEYGVTHMLDKSCNNDLKYMLRIRSSIYTEKKLSMVY